MPTTENARIDIRLSEQKKRLIENAARTRELSVSQFIIDHAVEAARHIIDEDRLRVLSERDRKAFMRMLDHDTPNAALKSAAKSFVSRYGR